MSVTQNMCSRADHVEERVNDLEDRNVEIIQLAEDVKLRFKRVMKAYKSYQILSEKQISE